jgi:hypothetical protein
VQRLFSSDNHQSLFFSKAEKEKELKERGSTHGFLPLHCVADCAEGKYAMSVFRPIFNAYPSAAEEKGYDGSLPLHLVAGYMGDGDGGLEAIQLLLKEYPQAAKEKDSRGDLPIHRICWNSRGATLAMVRELLSAHPQSINEKGHVGDKPYAVAVDVNFLPADAIEYLRCAEQGESVSVVQSTSLSLPFSLSLSIPSLFSLSLFTQTLLQIFLFFFFFFSHSHSLRMHTHTHTLSLSFFLFSLPL